MATSGTIKSWTVPKNTYHDFGNGNQNYQDAHYSFEWESEVASPGKTKISYKLYRRGRSSSPTKLYNHCKLVITDQSGNTQLSIDDDSPGTKFTDVLYKEGSFTITHEDDGSANFTANFTVMIVTGVNHETSTTAALDTNYPYTSCGAPTSISLSPSIISPGGKITVSWSGAAGGTANSISSYQVYWRVTSNGSAPTASVYSGTKNVTTSATSGSTDFYLDENLQIRGYKIVCGVITRGTAGSSYYSGIKTSSSIIINQLPSAPTINDAQIEVETNKWSTTLVAPSDISSSKSYRVWFNISPGVDPNGTACSVWYNTENNTSSSTKISNPADFYATIDKATTFYFWTWENSGAKEGSSPTTKTISVNTKPELTISTSGNKIASVNLVAGDDNYIISPKIEVDSNIGGQSGNNKYTYKVYYGNSSTNLTSSKVLISNTTSSSYQIADIRSEIGTATSAKYYQLRAVRNDGIENSSEVSGAIYYVTKIPVCNMITNKLTQQQVSGFDGYFLNELSVLIDYDDGYNQVWLSNGSRDSSIVNLNTYVANQTKYGDFTKTTLSNFFRGNFHALNVYLKYGNYNVVATNKNDIITNWYRIKQTTISNFQTPGTIYPFQTGNKVFSLLNWFGNITPTETQYKQYGISDFSSSIFLMVNGSARFPLPTTSTYGDILNFTLSESIFYNLIKNTNLNKNDSQTVNSTVIFENAFGESSQLTQSVVLDFREVPEALSNDILARGIDSSGIEASASLDEWDFLKEGLDILYTGNWTSYNSNPWVQIEIERIIDGNSEGWSAYGAKHFFPVSSETLKEGKDFGPGNPYKYTFEEELIQTVKQIATTSYGTNFRIVVGNDSGKKKTEVIYYSTLGMIDIRGQSLGLVQLNSALYNEGFINFVYTIADLGIDSKINESYYQTIKKLQVKTMNGNYEDVGTIDTSPAEIEYPVDDICFIRVAIELTLWTKLDEALYQPVTYITYSNELSVYGLTPTISYRQNFIGINTKNVGSIEEGQEPILIIHTYNNKDGVYFVGTDGSFAKVDTENKALNNFVITGGDWEKDSSIIPSPGLAAAETSCF